MSGRSTGVESNRGPYTVKAIGALACLVIEAGIAATADFHDLPSLDRWYPMVLIGVQFLMQVLVALCLFMLFAGTYVFQVGLISVLLREFRTVLLLSLLYFLVFVAYAAVKALLIFGTQTPEEQFWSDSGFAAASTATRLLAVVWYTFVLEAVLRLGRVAWYHRTPWVSGFRDAAGASI